MRASLFGPLASGIEGGGGWLCVHEAQINPASCFYLAKYNLKFGFPASGTLHFIFGVKDSLSYVLHTAESLITFMLFDDTITGLSRTLTFLSHTYFSPPLHGVLPVDVVNYPCTS